MIAALSSHLTSGADALIVYIRVHAANNLTCSYLDVSMPYNSKQFIIIIIRFSVFEDVFRTGFLPVHLWCGMYCVHAHNHTQPLSLVLMAPDCIHSTKDALVRLFLWYLEGKIRGYMSSIKSRDSNVSTHQLPSLRQGVELLHNKCIISATRL